MSVFASRALVREILEGLEYKEGWSFNLLEGFGENPNLVRVRWRVDDVHGQGTTYLIGHCDISTLEWMKTPEMMVEFFMRDLWRVIEALEGHERMELLKFKDKPVWNPHPPDNDGQLLTGPQGLPDMQLEGLYV